MKIEVVDDDSGVVVFVGTLPRPSCHGILIAHLSEWLDECRLIESGPRLYVQPIPFPPSTRDA
jgi:hypothetical protein